MDKKVFWSEYNKYVINRLSNLLKDKREKYGVDLHIHTKYYVDGKGDVIDKINRAKDFGFDIISLCDHDSISAYSDLFDVITNKNFSIDDFPIIIPGVEFSVYYEKYTGLCHVLKYFLNPNDESTQAQIKHNMEAYWKRAEIQINNFKNSIVFQKMLTETDKELLDIYKYNKYLEDIGWDYPEYASLVDYIGIILDNNGYNTFDVYNILYDSLRDDECIERRNKRKELLDNFLKRHSIEEIKNNGRLLMPLLAPLGIDDNKYVGYDSIGSLSVESYSQLNIRDLKNGIYILAHPDVDKLHLLLDEIPFLGSNIVGYEINKCNRKSNIDDITQCARRLGFILTVGSDSHDNEYQLYNEIEFYSMDKSDLIALRDIGRILYRD